MILRTATITVAIFSLVFGSVLFAPAQAQAVGYCYCETDVQNVFSKKVAESEGRKCLSLENQPSCNPQDVGLEKAELYTCAKRDDLAKCEASMAQWEKQLSGAKQTRSSGGSIIPSCLLEDKLPQECRDIKIFIVLLINISRYIFTVVGALALAVFVYGGFMLIISSGNPEKVKKGTDAMFAAVIGLAIVFTAYLLVNFVGEVIGIKEGFNLLR